LSVARRLISSFGATILGPAVTVLVQLVNVPVMLRFWGPELYGEWLLLSAIPTYLLLTDMGFGNVAGSDMTIRVNAGDREGADGDVSEHDWRWCSWPLPTILVLLAALFWLDSPPSHVLHFSQPSLHSEAQDHPRYCFRSTAWSCCSGA
jgi:hypothetical protein